MKCAGCDVMFHGIEGLMPHAVASTLKIRGMKQYDMLCKDCTKQASEAKAEYAKASRGQ